VEKKLNTMTTFKSVKHIGTRTKRARRSGFTLSEVIAATFIAMIGLSGAMSVGIWQLRATQFNQRSSEATAAGQQKLEELNQEPYANISSGSDTIGEFGLNWTVSASNRFKIVDLRIDWDSSKGTQYITLRDLFPDDKTSGYIIAN
jgi:Tfp pilus assembly protein PilV